MRVECTLPNASTEISGFAFEATGTGTVVSVADLPAADAARLLSIRGYREYAEPAKKPDPAKTPESAKKPEPTKKPKAAAGESEAKK